MPKWTCGIEHPKLGTTRKLTENGGFASFEDAMHVLYREAQARESIAERTDLYKAYLRLECDILSILLNPRFSDEPDDPDKVELNGPNDTIWFVRPETDATGQTFPDTPFRV